MRRRGCVESPDSRPDPWRATLEGAVGDPDPLRVAAALAQREHLLLGQVRYAAGMANLPDKFAALAAAIAVFTEQNVAYALIGGLAVGVRSGVPRATLDIDFAIATGVDRVQLGARLVERGFRLTGQFAHSLNFKHDSGEPVQLAFDEGFDAMIERAEAMHSQGLELRVVTKQDLISMKRRAASDPSRPRSKALRDQADIALLEGDIPESDEGW
jgi:hypothetical protein